MQHSKKDFPTLITIGRFVRWSLAVLKRTLLGIGGIALLVVVGIFVAGALVAEPLRWYLIGSASALLLICGGVLALSYLRSVLGHFASAQTRKLVTISNHLAHMGKQIVTINNAVAGLNKEIFAVKDDDRVIAYDVLEELRRLQEAVSQLEVEAGRAKGTDSSSQGSAITNRPRVHSRLEASVWDTTCPNLRPVGVQRTYLNYGRFYFKVAPRVWAFIREHLEIGVPPFDQCRLDLSGHTLRPTRLQVQVDRQPIDMSIDIVAMPKHSWAAKERVFDLNRNVILNIARTPEARTTLAGEVHAARSFAALDGPKVTAPRIIEADMPAGLCIEELVFGYRGKPELLDDHDMLTRIFSKLARWGGLEGSEWVTVKDHYIHLMQRLESLCSEHSLLSELLTLYRRFESANGLKGHVALCSVHGDLDLNNIVVDEDGDRVVLLDWEFTRPSICTYDVISLAFKSVKQASPLPLAEKLLGVYKAVTETHVDLGHAADHLMLYSMHRIIYQVASRAFNSAETKALVRKHIALITDLQQGLL